MFLYSKRVALLFTDYIKNIDYLESPKSDISVGGELSIFSTFSLSTQCALYDYDFSFCFLCPGPSKFEAKERKNFPPLK